MTKALTSMLGIIFSFFSRNFPRKLKINKGLRISDPLSLASSQVSVFRHGPSIQEIARHDQTLALQCIGQNVFREVEWVYKELYVS